MPKFSLMITIGMMKILKLFTIFDAEFHVFSATKN